MKRFSKEKSRFKSRYIFIHAFFIFTTYSFNSDKKAFIFSYPIIFAPEPNIKRSCLKMTVFKQKVSVVLTLLIAMLLTPMFSSTPIHADAKALLDTNGNPVVAGYNYIMKVIDPRSKVADMYWYHSMKHDNHSSLHTSITDISLYEGTF
jgi:hypothetical protein